MTPEQREMLIAQKLQSMNPLPNDKSLVPTLREVQQCPVAIEQKQMTMFISKLVEIGDAECVPLITEGISEGLGAEFICRKSLEERTIVRMEEDPNLKEKLHALKEAEERVLQLQADLDTAAKSMDEMSKGMWAEIVKSYGLATNQRCYTVDEGSGVVKQVSLNCESCAAKTKMQDIRKRMTAMIFEAQKVKKND
jgi:hypothetical protein